MPDVSVLIPAYNGASLIGETLKRISESTEGLNAEIIVSDNASSDETAAVAERHPGVQVLRGGKNLGFGGAVNRAAAHAAGKVWVLLCVDVHPRPGALKAMLDFFNAAGKDTGILGGKLLYPDERIQMSCGPFPTLWNTVWRMGVPREKRKYYLWQPDRTKKVDWVTGAFMAFRRETYERIGGFDENYFMYYEDADICLRARKAGWETCYLPQAQAVHFNPYGNRKNSPEWLQKEIRKSQMLFFKKHRPAWEHKAIRLINRAYFRAKGWECE